MSRRGNLAVFESTNISIDIRVNERDWKRALVTENAG